MTPPVVIDSFRGVYSFLSNFWSSDWWPGVSYGGQHYRTVEHAYQAAKSLDPRDRVRIALLPTPYDAKRVGSRLVLRPGWDELRVSLMGELLRLKFVPGSRLASRMLALTGHAELVEGNDWGDTFWGVCRGQGENHLGKLLMEIREELRSAL